jgi:GAF domain-containing protein
MTPEKLEKLKQLNAIMLRADSLANALDKASELVKEIIDVDRVSIFLYNKKVKLLSTYKADKIDRLIFPATKGIAGYVATTKEIKVVNNTDEEPLFYKEVDKESGYHTYSILALPILDLNKEVIGVVEFINKLDEKFNTKDIAIAKMFTQYVAEPLETILAKENNV